MRSHLLEGTVRHRRARPFTYELEHDVYYFAIDLAELDEMTRRLRLVSRNRPNVVSFRDTDHLASPVADVRAGILDHLRSEGLDPAGWSDHPGHDPAGPRLRVQPRQLLPLPRRTGHTSGGGR